VQYVPRGDQSDELKGHGTHVVGTAVGRRAIKGLSESTGEVDGIARAAKVSFVDLGVSGKVRPNCVYAAMLNAFS
jgi:subtilisin family serine protease